MTTRRTPPPTPPPDEEFNYATFETLPRTYQEITDHFSAKKSVAPFALRKETFLRIERATQRPLIAYVTKLRNVQPGAPAFVEDGDFGDQVLKPHLIPPDGRLRMDLYCPPGDTEDGHWPAVIAVAGHPGTMESHPTPLAYKDIGWTVSMCQLIAVSGMVAIAYTNTDPLADLQTLFEHVHEGAASLRIDPARVGVIAVSGNVPTALMTVMQDARRTPACAVLGWGCLLDLDGATDVADAARQFGFANPGVGRTVADLRRDVPLLITRAGRDQFPAMNASIDSFIRHGLVENLPITFVNHAEGPHAFDLFDDSRTSRDILRQTLRFLRQHLPAERSDASVTSE